MGGRSAVTAGEAFQQPAAFQGAGLLRGHRREVLKGSMRALQLETYGRQLLA